MITAEIHGNKVEVHEPDEIGCVASYGYNECKLCCFRNGIPNAPSPYDKTCGAPCLEFSPTSFFTLQIAK